MIRIENITTLTDDQMKSVIMGMRNPLNSWARSDDGGDADQNLMLRLRNAGTDHRKFMRMMTVWMDITAPLYWWKEFDTYKVGTVANSCSTMHTITNKYFEIDDFSYECMTVPAREALLKTIDSLNTLRNRYFDATNEHYKKEYWYSIIQLLPSSFNQKRTVMLNYEVLANVYSSRHDHKLYEWRTFCSTMEESLPMSWLFTGE